MKQLNDIIEHALIEFGQISTVEWDEKSTPDKWSKKEILGHLVDSARMNLQRFTEIQYFESPYQITPYLQEDQVRANDYQNQSLELIKSMWLSINKHINYLFSRQTEDLSKEVILPHGKVVNLKFLMDDYVSHLQHHLNQIMKNKTNAVSPWQGE